MKIKREHPCKSEKKFESLKKCCEADGLDYQQAWYAITHFGQYFNYPYKYTKDLDTLNKKK